MRIKINGKIFAASQDQTILEVLDANGISVPTLCYDSRIKPSAACRICEVNVAGQERPLCACAAPVCDGMEIETHTPELVRFRAELLEMLARDYPAEAVAKDPDKPFHTLLREHGVSPPSREAPLAALTDRTHPYIAVDMSRCIHCYRCVHICDELEGRSVWKIHDRGAKTRVVWDRGESLKESSCVSCGACVDSCPSGALEDVSREKHGPPQSWTRTTCPYCGVGCEMNVGTRDDRIVAIEPVLDSPVSRGHLCVKGRYGASFVDAHDRVTEPMVRRGGRWVKASWDEAMEAAARELLAIRDTSGADALGVLASARGTNEEAYLAQKFARAVLGTHNVDCCARVCHAPTAAGLARVLGTGAATNSFEDIEMASAFLIVGANPTENHPIVGARIRQRVLAGAPLVVVDPRATEFARMAQVHLALRPGTNIPLLNAMACVLIKEGLFDRDYVARRVEGFEDYAAAIRQWTPERAASVCGVDAEAVRLAARLYARHKPAMCVHGLGVTEHIQGTEGVMAIAHLALLTGNIGVRGGGVNPLRGQNNVQGTALMGCEPGRLTGSQKIEASREAHERAWGVAVPHVVKTHGNAARGGKGLTLLEMLDSAAEGRLKGLVMIGYDVYLSNPDAHSTAKALGSLSSLVIVDLFLTETARNFGTVFLPAASSFEKDGTFMNSERRVQRVRRAVTPRGSAKSDLEILCLLAARMGFAQQFRYGSAEEVWDEARTLWPAVRGITYRRLEKNGLQWPCPAENHSGTPVLHTEGFTIGPKAKLKPIAYRESAEAASKEYPFLLNTGRSLFHFNAATMTGRSRNAELQTDRLLQIHPRDAEALGIGEGHLLCVESTHGNFEAHASITDAVRPGELFATFHDPAAFVNRVTGKGRDPIALTPEYKVTAVRVLKIGNSL